ncbi:MAG: GNAT family N-acetyltransferase [Kofleriaceae bacterium]|nr:GNAT family N-acetyltransferase [Kofleriaceae bacterium]
MTAPRLRGLVDADRAAGPDDAALHALHVATAGAHPAMAAAELAASLRDAGRDHGRRVVIAERDGAVVGGAGWVEAPPWCFGAPLIAAAADVAAALIDHVVARARACGARHLRISAYPGESGKRAALVAAGLTPALDFLTLARPLAPGDGAPWRGRLHRRRWAELDVDRFTALSNAAFEGVANAPPMARDAVAELLAGDGVVRDATAAYVDDAGAYQAFVVVLAEGEGDGRHAVVDSIGVAATGRGQGLGRAVLDDALAAAAAAGFGEMRALIASQNHASLALHGARGFTERARRSVFQLEL